MGIFKAYDVRGIYPEEIDEDTVERIGNAFAAFLGARSVVVGRDMRPSSVPLADALIAGITAAGAEVVELGMCTTPMCYFAAARLEASGGIMVTASHNPARWNGLKFCREHAIPVGSATGLAEIERAVRERRPEAKAAVRGGRRAYDVVARYAQWLRETAGPISRMKVAIDTGNGAVGPFVERCLGQLGLEIVPLFFEPDGTFPNHEANPLIEENRRDITAEVIRQGADVGIAWDGDADRCFFIDGSGEFVSGDFVTALLAEAFLLRHPGATIIYDLRASHAVRDVVARYGGRALRNRVGHAFIKQRMREEDAIFGGEVTGHYYFRDFSYADNGFIPALLMLELMSRKNQPLRQLLQPFRGRYFISGEINTKLASLADVPRRLDAIEARYRDAALDRMDGISVDYPEWHFNVRPSNTEPLLRLNLEAATPELMADKRDEVLALIRG